MDTIHHACYEILRAHGMTRIFGNPGSNELPFLKNFPAGFEYILGLHEGAVIAMADGYAQAKRQPVLVNLHSAAGTGNAMGGLVNAWNSHTPLVIMAGQQVREMIGLEALLTNIDATTLPRPLVKWSYEPSSAEQVPLALSRAIHIAGAPARGPVYLSIPYGDWDKAAPANTASLSERHVQQAGVPSEGQLKDLCAKLNEARHPVLIVGPDVDADAANAEVIALGEKLRAPVWMAPSSPRCAFPTDHPCFRGLLSAGIASIARLLEPHDLAFVVGAPVFRYHQYEPGEYLAVGTKLFALTCDIQEAARAPVGDALVGDIRLTLQAMLGHIGESSRSMPQVLPRPVLAPERAGPVNPERVFDLIGKIAPRDAIYVNESTSTVNILWQRLPMVLPGSYYFGAGGGLGFGLPAAVGGPIGGARATGYCGHWRRIGQLRYHGVMDSCAVPDPGYLRHPKEWGVRRVALVCQRPQSRTTAGSRLTGDRFLLDRKRLWHRCRAGHLRRDLHRCAAPRTGKPATNADRSHDASGCVLRQERKQRSASRFGRYRSDSDPGNFVSELHEQTFV
jgi:benzoylformate decarboxylase